MQTIIGMPPHIIIIGIPIAIIAFIAWQRSVIACIEAASIGLIVQTMPSLVISHVTLPSVGVGIGIIIGMPMPIAFIGMPMPIAFIGMPMPIAFIGIPMPIVFIGIPMGLIGIPIELIGIPIGLIGIALIGIVAAGIMVVPLRRRLRRRAGASCGPGAILMGGIDPKQGLAVGADVISPIATHAPAAAPEARGGPPMERAGLHARAQPSR